jgi:hypothetical protein
LKRSLTFFQSIFILKLGVVLGIHGHFKEKKKLADEEDYFC